MKILRPLPSLVTVSFCTYKIVLIISDYLVHYTYVLPVNCSIEHVILNVACSLEDEGTVNIEKYCLRVWGLAEYFAPNTTLAQYEYIHQCIKLEKDIELAIQIRAQIKRSISRTVSIYL